MIVIFSEMDKQLYRRSAGIDTIKSFDIRAETGLFTYVTTTKGKYALEDCLYTLKKIVLHAPKASLLKKTRLELAINIMGLAVLNEKNESIGSVYDFSFESETFVLDSIFTKKMLWGKRIIGRKNIIEITPQYIQIKDDTLVTETKPVIEAVPT